MSIILNPVSVGIEKWKVLYFTCMHVKYTCIHVKYTCYKPGNGLVMLAILKNPLLTLHITL